MSASAYAAHADVGDAELDHAAGAEQLVGELDGQRRGHVSAVVGPADHVLARQPHQRVGHVRRPRVRSTAASAAGSNGWSSGTWRVSTHARTAA